MVKKEVFNNTLSLYSTVISYNHVFSSTNSSDKSSVNKVSVIVNLSLALILIHHLHALISHHIFLAYNSHTGSVAKSNFAISHYAGVAYSVLYIFCVL